MTAFRFSSGDLSAECDDVDVSELPQASTGQPPLQQQPLPNPNGPPGTAGPTGATGTAGPTMSGGSGPPAGVPPSLPSGGGGPPAGPAPDLSLSFSKQAPPPPRGVSAPASPAKSRESLLQRVQSLTGAARDQGASIIGAAVSSATAARQQSQFGGGGSSSARCFTLLVLDDQNTDWSKYFRGKRLHGDHEIRVEQAEFREVSLTASGETGTMVSMAVVRNGTKVSGGGTATGEQLNRLNWTIPTE